MGHRRNCWRNCQAWNELKLPLSTTSDEACKLYDAALTQYVGWYEDSSLGGIETTVEKILEADQNFVMGHVLANGLELMGTGRSPRIDPGFKDSLNQLVKMGEREKLTAREESHVEAIKLCGNGKMREACLKWEEILVDHPTDMLAVKFAHDSYFYLGYQRQMRDSIARILPHWDQADTMYGYLMGMHSFGLVETNLFQEAEKTAKRGLEMNPNDAWSTHSLAHVYEMTGRSHEGISFLSSTMDDWQSCEMLACHNLWHWAVYHIEKGEHQAAVDIYDGYIERSYSKSLAMLDVVDACSLLLRLEFEGVDVGARWQGLHEVCRPHSEDHLLVFNDIHMLMSFLGNNDDKLVNEMKCSLENYSQTACTTNSTITRDVGIRLFEALVQYKECKYEEAVETLLPIRYSILQIGGSNAQRDIFELLLIQAALKSRRNHHNKLARNLLLERKTTRCKSPMTERLIANFVINH